jgi:hypothetical protein
VFNRFCNGENYRKLITVHASLQRKGGIREESKQREERRERGEKRESRKRRE